MIQSSVEGNSQTSSMFWLLQLLFTIQLLCRKRSHGERKPCPL